MNLERPVTLSARLGGHLVQGHVDGVGEVSGVERDDAGRGRAHGAGARRLLRYVVEKGSISVDGVSLTIAELAGEGMRVALIPHTLAVTTLGTLVPGDPVNLEVDVIAKYVERLMADDTAFGIGREDDDDERRNGNDRGRISVRVDPGGG